MSTIPAKQIAAVVPGVLSAGGSALDLSGLVVTESSRVPIGSIIALPDEPSVANYFGAGSTEDVIAGAYFSGTNKSSKLPGQLLFAQYPLGAVPAFLRGSNISSLTLPQLQAISGTLAVTVDGQARTANSLNLSGANSFSAAAALIAAALNAVLPQEATATASISAQSASFTASISGFVLNVTALTSGTIVAGSLLAGTGVLAGTTVDNQLSGSTGGIGTYAVSQNQAVTGTAMTAAYGLLNVSAIGSGSIAVGQTLTGTGLVTGTAGTTIVTGLGTGVGLTGTYYVTPSQTAASEAVTATATALLATYDSQSGAFVVTSGAQGTASTIAFATGSTAAGLGLAAGGGGVISQGAAGQTPGAFMTALALKTQNWAGFGLTFDPDLANGNTQKLAFAAWTATQVDEFFFACADTDVTPTLGVAASSLGGIIDATFDGTCLLYTPAGNPNNAFGKLVGFTLGYAASLNFSETNGRTTFFACSQSGLIADVTDGGIALNLGGSPQSVGDRGNGYNFYGAYGTANDQFVWLNRGFVSGKFKWLDSYVNQIWLNASFQEDIMVMFQNTKSIPYNDDGRSIIEAALLGTIEQALDFGAIRAGITLSPLQAQQVNAAAGAKIDVTLSTRGWYLKVGTATAQVRGARSSPPCTFWYQDGESVQALNLASILIQ